VDLSEHWEHHAEDWIAWARTSAHDGFWDGTWPTLREVLPPPTGLTVDLGCGEGRLGRELMRLSYEVVGIERSPTLVSAAVTAEPSLPVARSDAAMLPLPDCSVALVVACMSFMDIDDLAGAVAECGRVLVPGGHLCVALVHPFVSALDPSSFHTDAIRLNEPYLVSRRYEDHVARDGLKMTFASMHRPLDEYVAAWKETGLVVTDLREFGDGLVPWLMVVRTMKSATGQPEGLAR
jgi:SAM-dependent methyltransferase